MTSITDNGTGDYTVNYTTAMPDANYSQNVSSRNTAAAGGSIPVNESNTTTSCRCQTISVAGALVDHQYVNVVIVR